MSLGNAFAGTVFPFRSPDPTFIFVSVSNTCARRWVKVRGRKLDCVLICRAASAGKEKLAGARENPVCMDFAKGPEAVRRGEALLKAKDGTRGIVNAITIAALIFLSLADIGTKRRKGMNNVHDT